MPLPRSLGRFNRVVTNRVTGRVAGRLPGFGIVVHEGRRSGRRHRTPVNLFRRPGGVEVALTYGAEAQWVRNVLAAGHAEVETRGRTLTLANPRVVHDGRRSLVPPPVRPVLRALGVDAFLVADVGAGDRPVALEPEDLERLFVARVNAGDVEGLLDLFEPDAAMAPAPGQVAVGRAALRRVLEDLVASGTTLELGDQQPTLRAGDLALTSTRLRDGGVTAEVARRQPDGTWRWAIDRWNVLPD